MRQPSNIMFLMSLPWWLLVVLAALIYALGVHMLPALILEAPLLEQLTNQLPTLAGPVSLLLLVFAGVSAIRSTIVSRHRKLLLKRQTGIDSIRALSWDQFEKLIGEAYRQQGYEVRERGGPGADDGIDLILQRDGQLTLVQCKHWRSQKIGVSVVREHLGVMTAHEADHGLIVFTGEASAPAMTFAKCNGIGLVNGESLVKLVGLGSSATASAEKTVIAVPNCPQCESPMVERLAKRGPRAGSTFFGCSSYPRCRGTRELLLAHATDSLQQGG